jgi:transcriptional regulator with XRE-family HTH domain
MKEINQRAKEIRTALNFSQRDFAKHIFISHTLLGHIELGKRSINDRTIQLISSQFNVNKEWILNGKGDMFSAPPPDLQFEKLFEVFKQLNKPLRDCLLEHSKNLLKVQKENIDKK